MTSREIALLNPAQDPQATVACLVRLPDTSPGSRPAIEVVERAVSEVLQPCDTRWLAVCVASMLSSYYQRDEPQPVRDKIMADWLDALRPYPAWAVDSACRWWRSEDNPDRRRRPLEGDIVARVRRELRGVHLVPQLLRAQSASTGERPA